MCRKSFVLFAFVLVLGIVSSVPAEMVVHWRLDEGSGTTAFDSSGNGYDGTFVGTPQWVAGYLSAGAVHFDGDAAASSVAHALGSATSWPTGAIALWVKVDSVGQDNYSSAFTNHNPNSAGIQIDVDGGNPGNYRINPSGLIFGTVTTDWIHLAVTFDNTSATLYYNGNQSATGTLSASNTTFNRFAIGLNRNAANWIAATIDELRVYDHALSGVEVLSAMTGDPWPYAYGPTPADGALYESTWVNLKWQPGQLAVSHDVYLGDTFEDVNAGTGDTFRGNLATPSLIAGFPGYPFSGGLVPGTTYYWRIDEVNDADPDSPWKGEIWSFTVPPRKAYDPDPVDTSKFVVPNPALTWGAGLGAMLHYVYFGDNFDEVNTATGALPMTTKNYTPAGPLERAKTYYWRVDEFDGTATHKGDVWSFVTIPVMEITDPNLVGWWKLDEGLGTTAVDYSGYDHHGTFQGSPQWGNGYHDGALEFTKTGQYVDCGAAAAQEVTGDFTIAAWVQLGPNNAGLYEGIAGKLTRRGGADYMGFGIVRYNSNVFRLWVSDGDSAQINGRASSDLTYADTEWHHVAGVREGQTNALYVDGIRQSETTTTDFVPSEEFFHIGRQYSHLDDRYFQGLIDDVRIYNKAMSQEAIILVMRDDPLLAWQPEPRSGQLADIENATPLTWSRGDKATQHGVYFGTDKAAVANADASDTTGIYRGRQSATSYTPAEGLAWGGGPYFWRVDENNNDGTVTKGRIWSFMVADYLVVDDIESYNDLAEADPASNRIYLSWIDGFGTTTNGAFVGNLDVPLTERANVHGGGQAMPLSYDNNLKFSEATLTLTGAASDWTRQGVAELSLWFRGVGTNAPERIYVALNGTAVIYNEDTSLTRRTGWTPWVIPLKAFADQGVNLTNVTSITIGFGTRGNTTVAGGTGQMYFDDIRLYRPAAAP